MTYCTSNSSCSLLNKTFGFFVQSLRPLLTEVVYVVQTFRETMHCVDQCNNFGSSKKIRVAGWAILKIKKLVTSRSYEDNTYSNAFSSISNKTLRAVATPDVCTLPHRRHLSQPTQSIIRDTLRKCVLNSSFTI